MFGPPFTVEDQLPVDFDHLVYQHHGKLLPFVQLGPIRGFWEIAYVDGNDLLNRIASGHLDQDVVFVDHKSPGTGGDGRIALQKTYVLPDESRRRSLTIHCSQKIKLPGRMDHGQGLYVAAHEETITRFHEVNLARHMVLLERGLWP